MALSKKDGLILLESKIKDFKQNEKTYMDKSFMETEARSRFIDPFFQALGWEFDQTALNRDLWDVHREFSQKDKSSTKKPDYAFRIDKKVKFFVEAKAPWVPLTEKDPVFQAKRYAFSTNGKAPIVIITDFHEFRVFNSLKRPIYDNPLQGLIKELDLKYTDYLDKWELIYDVFSKEAVTNGSLIKLAGKITKSTKTLDDEFLEDIVQWREELAKNVAIRNKSLDVDAVNEAVQRILDRLIFIRNLEDREIEAENTLYDVTRSNENIYQKLLPLFGRLDKDYNGLLFKKHFSEEVEIDDKVLKDIINKMCYPISPFQFDVIEPEILGRIYEQFLGSKIRLTESHQAKVEVKPEVRHAGGVYYTPQYIVDYIVENTVDEKVKGLTPEQIAELKILDPACGSGSFLLGAFDHLIKYHEKWYAGRKTLKKYKNDYFINKYNIVKLSLKKKGEILRNNIFGVDIDREATEVAIMSLYLKMLEDGFDKGQTMLFLKGHVLPDMTSNIKCGNSLISRDQIFEQNMFGEDDLKAFDWKDEKNGFGEIFAKHGGFDCVISNPPYIKTQELQSFQPRETELYKKLYKSANKGNFDIYIIFIEKALDLLNTDGLIGYICPHKFFNSNYGVNIRRLISERKNITKILHFGINQVFDNATTYTCLLFLSQSANKAFDYYEFKDEVEDIHELIPGIKYFKVPTNKLGPGSWVFIDQEKEAYMLKIKGDNKTLEDITTNIFQGPKAGADPVFIVQMIDYGSKKCKCYSASLKSEVFIETAILKPYVKGKNIKQYYIQRGDEYIVFPYDAAGSLFSEKIMLNSYPMAYKYLSDKTNMDILLEREDGRFRKIWWSYSRPQNMQILDQKKILTPFNAFSSSFAYDDKGDFVFSAGVSGAYGILLKKEVNISYEYLLGVLNSSLIDKYLQTISTALRGGYFSYENKYIRQLPIYLPDKNDKGKGMLCGEVEKLVKQIHDLKKDNKRQSDVDYLRKKIDGLVCQLYGLKLENN